MSTNLLLVVLIVSSNGSTIVNSPMVIGDYELKVYEHPKCNLHYCSQILSRYNYDGSVKSYEHCKKKPQIWESAKVKYGLTEDEIKFLEKYALKNYGLLPNQENFMQIVQAPEVGGFNLLWADRLRKSIAKLFGALFI